jgi:cytochrome c-type biogenesis protein CcmF
VLVAGKACLILAFVTCLYGAGASIYGGRTRRRDWVASGRRAVYALFGTVLVAFVILEAAFLRSDFSFDLVYAHSSTTTPTFYRMAAPWSSQEGSLLLWLLLLSFWSSLILHFSKDRLREVAPYATAVLLGFGTFFAGLLVFMESPFQSLSGFVPAEGVGLNPLLRHPSMMIHPPMLYSGYTLFTVPFAFAVGALLTRRLNTDWIRSTRPFALAAWLCLGVGIVLGARWSYQELGWGGYWAWDPVENASLMPWLTGTAFLHSVMIQEKRGMLKVWNVSLVLATGVLAILGTFLVRSGILQSIHAFGASTLGIPFLILLIVMIGGSIALVASRSRELRTEHRLDSLFSREAAFLGNNLVLVAMCFVVFWGTFFPLISKAISGSESSVGPPWFDRYTVPLALVLVLLSGVGPLIAWRRATFANFRRNLLVPTGVAAVVLLAVAVFVGRSATALAMFALGAFVLAGVGQELWRGVRARRAMNGGSLPRALVTLVQRNRRRYGGYLVHAGVAILFVGIAASSSFQQARDVKLTTGQSARVGDYTLTYMRPTSRLVAAANGRLERIDFGADVRVVKGGKVLETLHTHRSYYPSIGPMLGPVSRFFEGETESQVGLDAGFSRDVWTAVAPDTSLLRPVIRQGDNVFEGPGAKLPQAQRDELLAKTLVGLTDRYVRDTPPATFRMLVSPLVNWIWFGAMIVALGGLIAIWPSPRTVGRRVSAAYAARVGREARQPVGV